MTRVLLVDDHPMIGQALQMLLRDTDYELVGRAKTAAEANKQIQSLKPDLVLLDVHLPDSSGLDVFRRMAPVAAILSQKVDPRILVSGGILWLAATSLTRVFWWTSGADFWTLALPQLIQGAGMLG